MKLYVGNLPFSVNDESLKNAFSVFGDIEEATIIIDKFSKRSKGFGFVTFTNDEAAQKAIAEMNGKDFEGRALKVSESKPMENNGERRSFGRSNSGGRSFGGNRDGQRSFGNRDGQRRSFGRDSRDSNRNDRRRF